MPCHGARDAMSGAQKARQPKIVAQLCLDATREYYDAVRKFVMSGACLAALEAAQMATYHSHQMETAVHALAGPIPDGEPGIAKIAHAMQQVD